MKLSSTGAQERETWSHIAKYSAQNSAVSPELTNSVDLGRRKSLHVSSLHRGPFIVAKSC